MRTYIFHKLAVRLVAPTAILIVAAFGASKAYAQGPCTFDPYSSNRYERSLAQTVANLQAQGATVTCRSGNTSGDIYITWPSGLYADIWGSDGGTVNMFVFDPVTGRTTYMYIIGGIDDDPMVIIDDSVYGFIDATDGWFSIFDPIGNPFSAAIENPLAAMMQWFNGLYDPNASPSSPHPPQPIQGPGGIQ